MMKTKTVDIKGRLFIGKEYIGKTFIFTPVSDKRIILDLAVVISAEEYESRRSAERQTRVEEVSEGAPDFDQAKKVRVPSSPDEDKEDHVPTAQVADSEAQSGPTEKVPSPQMKETSGKKEIDPAPAPAIMPPKKQRILAPPVRIFFNYIKQYKHVTPEVIFPALSLAKGEMVNHYLRENGLTIQTPGLSARKIREELRKDGLWPSEKPSYKEVIAFFKDMKVRLEAEGVDMSIPREISDETKELIEKVREVLPPKSKSLMDAMNKLNELGIRTIKGVLWTDKNFKAFCKKHFDESEMEPSKKPVGTEEEKNE
jgi:hypothetical protein